MLVAMRSLLTANQLKDDSDLGDIEVTTHVADLPAEQVERALQNGRRCALELQSRGIIHAALLVCQRQRVRVAERATGPGLAAPCPDPALGSVFA